MLWSCFTALKEPAAAIDYVSCLPGLTLISPQERNQEMAIADNQAVYFYGPDGRGPCFIIDGEKTSIHWFKGYLVIVSKEPKPIYLDSISGSVKPPHEESTGTLLTIYDLKGKYIAFRGDFGKRSFNLHASKAIGEPIKHVIADSGELIVVTSLNTV
jgi:hypothetical protein